MLAYLKLSTLTLPDRVLFGFNNIDAACGSYIENSRNRTVKVTTKRIQVAKLNK